MLVNIGIGITELVSVMFRIFNSNAFRAFSKHPRKRFLFCKYFPIGNLQGHSKHKSEDMLPTGPPPPPPPRCTSMASIHPPPPKENSAPSYLCMEHPVIHAPLSPQLEPHREPISVSPRRRGGSAPPAADAPVNIIIHAHTTGTTIPTNTTSTPPCTPTTTPSNTTSTTHAPYTARTPTQTSHPLPSTPFRTASGTFSPVGRRWLPVTPTPTSTEQKPTNSPTPVRAAYRSLPLPPQPTPGRALPCRPLPMPTTPVRSSLNSASTSASSSTPCNVTTTVSQQPSQPASNLPFSPKPVQSESHV